MLVIIYILSSYSEKDELVKKSLHKFEKKTAGLNKLEPAQMKNQKLLQFSTKIIFKKIN